MQAGELAARQELLADARTFFSTAADCRRRRGDAKGAWEVVVRSGSLDPDDVAARLAAARARVDLDDVTGALRELNDLAAMLIEQKRDVQSLAPLREIARLDPGSVGAPRELVRILLEEGLASEAAAYLRDESDARVVRHEGIVEGVPSEPAAALVEELLAPDSLSGGVHAVDPDSTFDGRVADPPTPPETSLADNDIEAVFAKLRDETAQRSGDEAADAAYTRGAAYFEAGELEQSSEQLRAAARSPRRRFAAASLLARIFQQQGRSADAVEWLGHAADAPGLASVVRFDTLVRLADLLEAAGEPASALAVCLELQAEAGDYQDLTTRIGRLSRAQAGG